MVRRLTVDVESAFGFRWQDWGKFALFSWLAMFAASWAAMQLIWMGGHAGYRVYGFLFVVLIVANGVPGTAALLVPAVKDRLRELPEAGALGLLSMSLVIGFALLVVIFGLLGQTPGMAAAVMAVGVMSFPVTFGLVFPLAIPLLCALAAWRVVKRHGATSRRTFAALSAAATVGWLALGFAGLIVANA